MMQSLQQFARYEAYQDSGVEWLGDIPQGWQAQKIKFSANMIVSNVDKHTKPLECAVKLCNYVDVYKNQYITNEITFMRATATLDEIRKFTLKLDDVIITKDSEDWLDIGVPALVKHTEPNLICGYHLAILRSRPVMAGEFLYWSLLSQAVRTQFSIQANGVTRYGISHSAIQNTWSILPTLAEQTAIANFLDQKTADIDQAIALKTDLIERLKEYKQITIQHAVTRGLDPHAKMKASGVDWIGSIPEGWEVAANRTLFIESKDAGSEGLPLLSVSIHSGVSTGELDESENVRGRVKIEDKSQYVAVQPNDIVFNMMRAWQGAIGAVRVAGMVSPAYIVARPRHAINAHFFEYQYRSPLFISQMNQSSKGITDFRKRLYWNEFKQLFTVVPPLAEQAAIVAHIEALSAKIDQATDQAQQQINTLTEYKTVLINAAVTGKIKVTNDSAQGTRHAQ